jgi:predicted nuclease of predicted toxin-antitoxin system
VRILLDECLDLRLRHQFPGHECVTVQYLGEKGAEDGKLLDRVGDQFDVLITVDGTMPFQQNLKKHNGLSAILITEGDGSIVTIMPLIHLIHAALKTIKPGEWVRIP